MNRLRRKTLKGQATNEANWLDCDLDRGIDSRTPLKLGIWAQGTASETLALCIPFKRKQRYDGPLHTGASSMTIQLSSLVVLSLLLSCTTSIGDGGGDGIADAAVDATPRPDALAPGLRDGEPCAITPEDDSGGCAPDYACTVVGAGPPQCRQTCPTLQFACAGYAGPGYSFCAVAYNDSAGQPAGNLCLVVCGDENQTLRGCDDGSCDGTCPGVWTCENDPINFGLKSCQ